MRKLAIFAARNVNIPKKFSNRSKTIKARLIRRVLYLLLIIGFLVGLMIFAPQVFAGTLEAVNSGLSPSALETESDCGAAGRVTRFDSGIIVESETPAEPPADAKDLKTPELYSKASK